MLAVKTAISIEKKLYDQAVNIAQALKVSRSRLFVIALQDFIERQNNREMLARINDAYSDEPDTSEQTLRRKSRKHHLSALEGKW